MPAGYPAQPGMPPMPRAYPPQAGMPPMPPQDNTPANFRIDSTITGKTPIKLPKHSLKFNEQEFIKLLAASISLSKEEKKKIIETIPKLKQFQIDELMKIFKEEAEKFAELPVRHQKELEKMVDKHRKEWEQLEDECQVQGQQVDEQSQVDDIKKQLGL
jgi:uncharacterized protein (DUF342 family)